MVSQVWKQNWVVHSEPVGTGEHALKYLAPCVYRVALSNSRILKVEDDEVTFRYQESDTGQWRMTTLPAMEFIRRFLQHVLPKGFHKIRYYGILAPTKRKLLQKIRDTLGAHTVLDALLNDHSAPTCRGKEDPHKPDKLLCPHCGGK